jgi:hypothetical protein
MHLRKPTHPRNQHMLPEHGILDFILFMRARNPVFWINGGIKNWGFRALHVATIFCNHLEKLLQKIIASQKINTCWQIPKSPNPDCSVCRPNGVSCLMKHLQIWDFGVCMFPDPEIPESRLLVLTLTQRFVPVWTSLNRAFRGLHVASIFCNHLAKLIQKIIAHPKKTNTSHRMLPSFAIILQSCYKRS